MPGANNPEVAVEFCLCGESVDPVEELDLSFDPDDSPSYNLLCPKCGFLFGTRPATEKVMQIPEASSDEQR